MGSAIGAMLGPAIGLAVNPLPIIAVIRLLTAPSGRAGGFAFALGWTVPIAAVSAVLVGVGGARTGSEPARWTFWLQLAIGLLFLVLALQQWRSRRRPGSEPQPSKVLAKLDGLSPAKAAGIAVLLAANPKNLALLASGAESIAANAADTRSRIVAVVLFVVLASLAVLIPVGVSVLGGDKSAATLSSWKDWLDEHTAAIVMTILLVLGFVFIGEALEGL